MRWFLIFLAVLFAGPAWATIGTPVLIGQNGSNAVLTTLSVTTNSGGTMNPGTKLVVAVRGRSGDATITDNCPSTNTWHLDKNYTGASTTHIEFQSTTLVAACTNPTVSLSWGSNGCCRLALVAAVVNVATAPQSAVATGQTNTATCALGACTVNTPTITPSNLPAVPAIIFCEGIVNNASTPTVAAGTNYTQLGTQTAGTTDFLWLDYYITSTTTGASNICAPTLGGNANQTWLLNWISYGANADDGGSGMLVHGGN